MRSFLRRVSWSVLFVILTGWSFSAAHAQCTPFGGCSGPGVQIMKASVANEQLQLEMVFLVWENVTKEVTVTVGDREETRQVVESVMRPTLGTQSWSLGDVKLYRGDRRRVQPSEVTELLSEPQYVLVCQSGQKLAKEWLELLRPETLVVFLAPQQIVAESAVAVPATGDIAPSVPVESAPQPAPVESAPAPAPIEIAPVPVEAAPATEAPLVPPDLIVAKVEEGSFFVREVSQHEFTQLLTVGSTDADGNATYETVQQVTQSKTETLTQLPADAIHAREIDGTEVDGDDLAARLASYTGVLEVSSGETVAEEFLNLFREGVLVIQAPSANAMPVMPAPLHEGGPQAPSEEGAPQA